MRTPSLVVMGVDSSGQVVLEQLLKFPPVVNRNGIPVEGNTLNGAIFLAFKK